METTQHGLQKPDSQDIYPFNTNVNILEEHLSDTDIHVNANKIAEIAESDELSQIDSTDTNSTMWGKIKKSISEVTDHVDTVASEITLGHIKIGTGLQMIEDVANVKIADDLITNDSTFALSAAIGKSLNDNKAPNNHASTATTYGVGNESNYGHVKLSDNYTSSEGAASTGVGASSKAVADAYNTLNSNFISKFTSRDAGWIINTSTLQTFLTHTHVEIKNAKVIQFLVSVSETKYLSQRLTFINNGGVQYQNFDIGSGAYRFSGYVQIDWSTGTYGYYLQEYAGWSINQCGISQVDFIMS